MTKDKITDLLKLTRNKQVVIAERFDMSKNSFNNKIRASESRFNLKDLILLADYTGTRLAFLDDKDKTIIEFDKSDLE